MFNASSRASQTSGARGVRVAAGVAVTGARVGAGDRVRVAVDSPPQLYAFFASADSSVDKRYSKP